MSRKTLLITLLSATALSLSAYPAAAADAPLTRDEVKKIVEEVISEKPGIVMEALTKYRVQEREKMAEKQKTALKDKLKEVTQDPEAPVVGNPKGDVTIVEFFDYHCGYCKKALPMIANVIKADPKVRVVFRELPILSEDSKLASQAALAVYRLKPEKYFEYHTILMESKAQFDKKFLLDEAKKLGIDNAALEKEMNSDGVKKHLDKTRELANNIGVEGTPFIVIGDRVFPGMIAEEVLKDNIHQIRKEAAKK